MAKIKRVKNRVTEQLFLILELIVLRTCFINMTCATRFGSVRPHAKYK